MRIRQPAKLKDAGVAPVVGEPRIVATVSSTAPTSFADVHDSKKHAWNPGVLFPAGYQLTPLLTTVKATVAAPIHWRLESLDNRFPAIETNQTGLFDLLPTVKLPAIGPVRVTAATAPVPMSQRT